jgi:hypothetical protein
LRGFDFGHFVEEAFSGEGGGGEISLFRCIRLGFPGKKEGMKRMGKEKGEGKGKRDTYRHLPISTQRTSKHI